MTIHLNTTTLIVSVFIALSVLNLIYYCLKWGQPRNPYTGLDIFVGMGWCCFTIWSMAYLVAH